MTKFLERLFPPWLAPSRKSGKASKNLQIPEKFCQTSNPNKKGSRRFAGQFSSVRRLGLCPRHHDPYALIDVCYLSLELLVWNILLSEERLEYFGKFLAIF